MSSTFSKSLIFFAFCYSVFVVVNQFFFFGLSYDESLFINAAIGKDETTFVSKHWHGVPLMVMDYIGALKSWLYIPIFKIWGVNLLSIRLPMVLLMYVNIYLIYIIGIKYFEKPVIYALIILLFTDFTFINLHKIDHGPSAIETFLKLISLYFVSKWRSPKSSIYIFAALFLGVYNKLNFIWYANALFGTYALTLFFDYFVKGNYKGFFQKLFHKRFIFNSLLFFIILAFFIFQLKTQNISPAKHTDFDQFIQQATYQYQLMVVTILNLRYGYLLGWNYFQQLNYVSANIFLLLLLSINLFWLFRKREQDFDVHKQLFCLLLLICIQYFFTKEASNIWHILLLYPFFQLLILNTVYKISNKNYFKFKYLFIGFSSAWVIYNIFTYYNFQKKLSQNCSFWLYEPKINTLINFINNRPETKIISLGYGIHSQLLVMDKTGKTYMELIADGNIDNLKSTILLKGNFINSPSQTLVIENVKSNLNTKRENYEAAKLAFSQLKLNLMPLESIQDGCGNPLYNIFKLEKLN